MKPTSALLSSPVESLGRLASVDAPTGPAPPSGRTLHDSITQTGQVWRSLLSSDPLRPESLPERPLETDATYQPAALPTALLPRFPGSSGSIPLPVRPGQPVLSPQAPTPPETPTPVAPSPEVPATESTNPFPPGTYPTATETGWNGYDADSRVVVIDIWRGEPPHGDLVTGGMVHGGGVNPDEIALSNVETPPPIDIENPPSVEELVRTGVTGVLGQTTEVMRDILSDPDSQVEVVNQSMGWSPIVAIEQTIRIAQANPEWAAQEFGVDPTTIPGEEFLQLVADRVMGVVENDPVVQQTIEEFDQVSEQVTDAGIIHVVAAGNSGEVSRFLPLDEEVFHNLLANEHNTVVGAVNGNGTPADPTDDEIAPFTSPNPHTDFVMEGSVGQHQGTSFSAPRVAAMAYHLLSRNPDLTPEQFEELVASTAFDLPDVPERFDGAGVVVPPAVLAALGGVPSATPAA